MTYKTSRNFDHLTTTPTPEYREQQRQKALKEALDEYEKIQD